MSVFEEIRPSKFEVQIIDQTDRLNTKKECTIRWAASNDEEFFQKTIEPPVESFDT